MPNFFNVLQLVILYIGMTLFSVSLYNFPTICLQYFNMGLGVVFARISAFLHQLQLASHDEKQNSNSKFQIVIFPG